MYKIKLHLKNQEGKNVAIVYARLHRTRQHAQDWIDQARPGEYSIAKAITGLPADLEPVNRDDDCYDDSDQATCANCEIFLLDNELLYCVDCRD